MIQPSSITISVSILIFPHELIATKGVKVNSSCSSEKANRGTAGIGTYVEHQSSNSSTGNLWTRTKSRIITTVDQGVGTSFVHHVLAGYRFVMRYYNEGDLIYIFGFSRGAYTARFLAEMLFNIGLLSRGNEEMVRFAWDTFSDYQRGRGNEPQTEKDKDREIYMKKFKSTFCRPGVGVYFLGLFDCVNSVGQFEIPLFRKSYEYIALPPAKYIRHAISIHERRLKFKPALFLLDGVEPVPGIDTQNSDVQEVWFAGNHADVSENPFEQLLPPKFISFYYSQLLTSRHATCLRQPKYGNE